MEYKKLQTDIAIIGDGIAALSLAYMAAKNNLKCVILGKNILLYNPFLLFKPVIYLTPQIVLLFQNFRNAAVTDLRHLRQLRLTLGVVRFETQGVHFFFIFTKSIRKS